MHRKRIIAKVIALFGIALFILNACSSFTPESSDVVITKFKQAVKTITAADVSLAANMASKDNSDNINFNLGADVKFDRANDNRKADIDIKLDGSLNAGGKTLDGNFDLNLITLGQDFYLNLADFKSSDPSMDSFKTAVQPYIKKWEHLGSDFIPANIKKLQTKDDKSTKEESDLKDLFIATNLFTISKEYGVEKLNGESVYHFGIKLDKNGVADYIKKASVINGVAKTDQEVTDAVTFVDSVKNIELWIGAKDYYLYKGVLNISGVTPAADAVNPDGTKAANKGDVNTDISLTYTAKSYNTETNIVAPTGFEEFNPITFLMSMQGVAAPAATGTTDDTTTPAATDKAADATAPADTTTTAPAADTTTVPVSK
jgi:hypothetical protein